MRSLVCLIPVPGYAVTEPFTGAFVVGLIVPRQGNLAISLTEKLEDVVSIIFLPLVCVPNPSRFHMELTPLTVLHTLWSLDRPRSTQLWHYLGVHDCHMYHCLRWQIRWMLRCGAIRWIQLA